MTDILPFGTDEAPANPLNITQQTLFGLTVVDINCNSSWDPQGGVCTVKLIQDTNQYLENVVVGSPKYFEIVDSEENPIFRFYGILLDISRDVDASSKSYTATIQSPTLLLEACSIITEAFAGYGGAIEGAGANVPACLDFGNYNSLVDYTKVYNVLNVFGVYENDSYGLSGAGFGRSVVNDDGIRIDFFAYAINELLNGNTTITPVLGSNIIYGADAYTNTKAYAYNFDIYGFLAQVANYIPNNYRVKATNLLDFINEICEFTNHIYYVDLLKPTGAGNVAFGSGHVSTFIPIQTHANTIYGGQVVIITQNRTVSAPTKFPLSAHVVGREASDKLGGNGQTQDLPLDIGMQGDYHPDGPPVASSPYGGEFPVEAITKDELERFISSSLKVRLNTGAVGARYITGGFQSRINYISSYGINRNAAPEIQGSTCSVSTPADVDLTPDVYSYWGEIDIVSRTENEDYKNIPIITKIIDDDEYIDSNIVLIDMFQIFGNLDVTGVMRRGVYAASINEIQISLVDYQHWQQYLVYTQPAKLRNMQALYNRVTTNNQFTRKEDGTLTFWGRAKKKQLQTAWDKWNVKFQNMYGIADIADLEANINNYNKFFNQIFEAVSKIAEEHYGKSFAVKSPAFAIKSDVNDESPLNSFTKSWDLSDTAYIDPTNYGAFQAPKGGFIKSGRVSGYANYYSGASPKHRTTDATPFWWYPNTYPPSRATFSDPDAAYMMRAAYNQDGLVSFKNYSKGETYPQLQLVSVPAEIDKDYLLVPPIYFTYYNENSNMVSAVDLLMALQIPYNGIGCIPYAKTSTKGVFRVVGPLEKVYNTYDEAVEARENMWKEAQQIDAEESTPIVGMIAQYPKGFGIPQQSNRYVYGPWTTQISVPYGTKIEYERVDSLIPENYLIPVNVNIGGINTTVVSGYAGMNEVGQLIANTIEGFDFLFTEEGSVTIAGYPTVTHLGESLIANGPLVSDISISIVNNQVTTSYNMTTFAPKFGRGNEYVMNKLAKLSKRLTDG